MKNLFYVFCICFSISVIFSCIKEEDHSLFYDCTELLTPIEDLNLDLCSTPSIYTPSEINRYQYSLFNPLNSNEIIFFHKNDTGNFNWEIWRYDICNGSHRVIADSVYYSHIDWSPQNWILYRNHNDGRKLYKIKGNKTDREKISDLQNVNVIRWKRDGSGYLLSEGSFANDNRLSLFDFNHNLIRHIEGVTPDVADWRGNLVVVSEFPYYFLVYNLQNEEYTNLSFVDNSRIKSVHFFKDNHVLWNTSQKIAYTNLNTLEHTIIKEAKPYQNFHHLDLSLDEQTIVLDQAQLFEVGNCIYEVRRHLSLMNIDGTNERKINIPL